jgi:hypothetical protein
MFMRVCPCLGDTVRVRSARRSQFMILTDSHTSSHPPSALGCRESSEDAAAETLAAHTSASSRGRSKTRSTGSVRAFPFSSVTATLPRDSAPTDPRVGRRSLSQSATAPIRCEPHATGSGTRSPPTCSRRAMTSAPSRSCWGTTTSVPRCSMPTFLTAASR